MFPLRSAQAIQSPYMRPPFDVYHDMHDDRLAHVRSPRRVEKGTQMTKQHAIAYYLVVLTLISATGFVLGIILLR